MNVMMHLASFWCVHPPEGKMSRGDISKLALCNINTDVVDVGGTGAMWRSASNEMIVNSMKLVIPLDFIS